MPNEQDMPELEQYEDQWQGLGLLAMVAVVGVGMAAASQSQNKSSAPDVADIASGLHGVQLSDSTRDTGAISQTEAVAGIHTATKETENLDPNVNLDGLKPEKPSSRHLS